MKTIPLTQGQVALVDDQDFEELSKYRWRTARVKHTSYARRNVSKRRGQYGGIFMHRQILQAPDGRQVDHQNGNGLDNQRANIRVATGTQNHANRARLTTNTSGYRGVSWSTNAKRWMAYIKVNRKGYNLGYFIGVDDAARAYDAAARRLFGEFARPNFPEHVVVS